jgi:hypothetical protein
LLKSLVYRLLRGRYASFRVLIIRAFRTDVGGFCLGEILAVLTCKVLGRRD